MTINLRALEDLTNDITYLKKATKNLFAHSRINCIPEKELYDKMLIEEFYLLSEIPNLLNESKKLYIYNNLI